MALSSADTLAFASRGTLYHAFFFWCLLPAALNGSLVLSVPFDLST